VYDVALNLSPEFKVFTFAFPHGKGSAASSSSSSGGKGAGKAGARGASSDLARQPPRKILLSPNKRLLLMHGALHKGQNSLLVYVPPCPLSVCVCTLLFCMSITRRRHLPRLSLSLSRCCSQPCLLSAAHSFMHLWCPWWSCSYQIMEDTPPYFRLIFYDMSFTFLDACFSPDSKSLVTIPSRYPCFIFLLNLNFVLGRVRNQHASSSGTSRHPFKTTHFCAPAPLRGCLGLTSSLRNAAAAQARATTEATQGNGTIDIASSFAFDAAAESDTVRTL